MLSAEEEKEKAVEYIADDIDNNINNNETRLHRNDQATTSDSQLENDGDNNNNNTVLRSGNAISSTRTTPISDNNTNFVNSLADAKRVITRNHRNTPIANSGIPIVNSNRGEVARNNNSKESPLENLAMTQRPGAVHIQPTASSTTTVVPTTAAQTLLATAQPVIVVASSETTNTTNSIHGIAVVSMTHLEEERNRLIRETRENYVAEVAHAEPVVDQSQHRNKADYYYFFCLVLVLVVVAVATVSGIVVSARQHKTSPDNSVVSSASPISKTTEAPTGAPAVYNDNGQRIFTSTQQLYDAVDTYQAHLEKNVVPIETSPVAMEYGYPIGTWVVSRITDFSRVFDPTRTDTLDVEREPSQESSFDEDLSGWNMSNAIILHGMFAGAGQFSGRGLGSWDVSKVTDFSFMFARASKFTGNVSMWDTSSGTTMRAMFLEARLFNGDVSRFDVSKVQTMDSMFSFARAFEGQPDLRSWNVSNVVNMQSLFSQSSISGHIAAWDTSRVTDMKSMFWGARQFNDSLSNWSVGRVLEMAHMFRETVVFVGGDLTRWNTSNVVDMNSMFHNALSFNGDISTWDVSRVTNMDEMFCMCPQFDGDISEWNTGGVVDMSKMFYDAVKFSGDLSRWDTRNAQETNLMFHNTDHFNSDLSRWDVSRIRDATEMFNDAEAFNYSLCAWGDLLSPDTLVTNMFNNSACANTTDPSLLRKPRPGPFCTPCSG